MSDLHEGIDLRGSELAKVKSGLDLCVHCGFCLQACPTYLALEDENDSPRGRIVLMRALLDGDVALDDPAVNTHIQQCLGCRGCETACPSGVPFGHLLEGTRATLREHNGTPLIARMMLAVFAQPVLLSIVMTFARIVRGTGMARLLARLPGRFGTASAMLAATSPTRFSIRRSSRPPNRATNAAAADASAGNAARTVALFEGCVMRELYGHVHDASRAVLARNGLDDADAPGQRCCGALHAHTGDLARARELARVNIAAFEKSAADRVAVNAAGCGAMLKEYATLLKDDPEWSDRAAMFSQKVRDISELLEQHGPVEANPVDATVAYDAPCHLQHAQRVTSAPLAVLGAIPGLRVVQTPGSDKCCGAAGIYNLLEPRTSAAVLAPKLDELATARPDIVCTGNPGCMMQIGAGFIRSGSSMQVAHPVELLGYAYERNGSRKD